MKSHTRAPRLLVVDDDPTILATYCEVLEACGFQVTTCARPSDAMQQYEASPKAFTAILTDYHLPEYNGVRLAWKLRSLHPERPPVFLLTGELDLRRILNEANQAGIECVLPKPFSLLALVERLKGLDDDRDALAAADAGGS